MFNLVTKNYHKLRHSLRCSCCFQSKDYNLKRKSQVLSECLTNCVKVSVVLIFPSSNSQVDPKQFLSDEMPKSHG